MRATDSTTAVAERVTSRRRMFGQVGLAAAGAAVLGRTRLSAQAITDFDILNFALNLEYLEAEYYLRGVFDRGLNAADITGMGNLGPVIVKPGSTLVPFTTPLVQQYAREIALDEEAHVRFIRAALQSFGQTPVARPTIDLRDSFTTAARAAGLIGPSETFDPYANENNFLLGAFIFEDVGVTAYKGAARLIQNATVLEAAAGILAVEAYHAGNVRTVLFARGFLEAAQRISDLRDAADGPDDLDQGLVINGRANITPLDANGRAFGRSAEQVLNIVYLGGAAANFGFFPNRVNGTIQ